MDNKILKTPEIIGSTFFINIVSSAVYGIHGIHAYAALETRSCFLSENTLHFYFIYQILAALMKISETVDSSAGKVGGRRHQFPVFRILREVIGHSYGIE